MTRPDPREALRGAGWVPERPRCTCEVCAEAEREDLSAAEDARRERLYRLAEEEGLAELAAELDTLGELNPERIGFTRMVARHYINEARAGLPTPAQRRERQRQLDAFAVYRAKAEAKAWLYSLAVGQAVADDLASVEGLVALASEGLLDQAPGVVLWP